MSRLFLLTVALVCCFGLSGCDFPEQKRPVSGIGGVDIDPATTMSGGQSSAESNPGQNQVATPAPTPPPEVRRPMEVGAQEFKKGQYGRTSILTSNITSFYRTQERINIMMITKNMDLYKAGHDNQVPKSYEEYQREILPGIKLPELKEGCRYEYDPETGELYIVHPL